MLLFAILSWIGLDWNKFIKGGRHAYEKRQILYHEDTDKQSAMTVIIYHTPCRTLGNYTGVQHHINLNK